MEKFIQALLSILRIISPAVLLGLAITAGIILFIGDKAAEALGIMEIRQIHKGTFGIVFLGSLSIFITQSAWAITGYLNKRRQCNVEKKEVQQKADDTDEKLKRQLRDLTPDEKAYLAPYIHNEENTQLFRDDDGVAGGLRAKGIVFCPTNIGNLIDGFPYNLQPWARRYLNEHPELLEGANPKPQRPPPY